jgi:hypothetical protein
MYGHLMEDDTAAHTASNSERAQLKFWQITRIVVSLIRYKSM